jgi:hypothetical protein
MKRIATIIITFWTFSSLHAQYTFYFNDPYLFARGTQSLSLDSQDGSVYDGIFTVPYYAPPYRKLEEKLGKYSSLNNYTNNNCTQLKMTEAFDNQKRTGLDSFVYINGLKTALFKFTLDATGKKTEYWKERYFYNNRSKLDSVWVDQDGKNLEILAISFTYNAQDKLINTRTTLITVSSGKRTPYAYTAFKYNTIGDIIEYSDSLYRFSDSEGWRIVWEANKIKQIKQYASFNTDTITHNFSYVGTTSVVQRIVSERYNRTTRSSFPFSRYTNTMPNAKGFPSRIFVENSIDSGRTWLPLREQTFKYYPGDTLVFRNTYSQLSPFLTISDLFYEYCGIPLISPTNEIASLDFKVYPNPTNGLLNIEIPQNTEGVSILIFNAVGSIVAKTNKLNIDVSNLPSGVYWAQVKQKEKIGMQRFIVSH